MTSLVRDVDTMKSDMIELKNRFNELIDATNEVIVTKQNSGLISINLTDNLTDLLGNKYSYDATIDGKQVPLPFTIGFAISLLLSNVTEDYMNEEFIDIHIETVKCFRKTSDSNPIFKTDSIEVVKYLIDLALSYNFFVDNKSLNYSIKCEIIRILKENL